MKFDFQPVTLSASTPDDEGMLVLCDDRLVAVISRLSAIHGDREGRWFIEATFRILPLGPEQTFETLGDVELFLSA